VGVYRNKTSLEDDFTSRYLQISSNTQAIFDEKNPPFQQGGLQISSTGSEKIKGKVILPSR
jgi:hypothetical protein